MFPRSRHPNDHLVILASVRSAYGLYLILIQILHDIFVLVFELLYICGCCKFRLLLPYYQVPELFVLVPDAEVLQVVSPDVKHKGGEGLHLDPPINFFVVKTP